jgi:PAS domain S-box-containing protein
MPPSIASRRTIWIVDDSPTDAERLRRALAADHTTEVMNDGSVALERLATGAMPDLLVLDWMMPGVTGLEVCRYLRASRNAGADRLPILLLTAHNQPGQVSEALTAGANDYLAKPFQDEELKARIASLLRTRDLILRAEHAEANVRTLLANAPDAIFAVDANGAITYANEEGLRILQRPREEILGRKLVELVPGMSLRHISLGSGESFFPAPDVQIGERIYSPSIRLLPSDSAAATTVALRDVTARRQTDMRRLDFYSIIAHDLRTPLGAILLRLELTFRGKHGVLPASLLGDLRKIENNVRAMVAMINDFLELARLEGLGHKIDPENVDLTALVRATMEDFRPLLEANSLEWATSEMHAAAHVQADPRRISQVLANLLGNAVKFTPPGGWIRTHVMRRDHEVEVAIEDNGHGIREELLPSLFDRYTRAEHSAGGSGLGLMIVREIVHAHGGTVGVTSSLGKGSRFWFRLPRSTP